MSPTLDLDALIQGAGGTVHRLAARAARRSAGLSTATIDVDGLAVVLDEGGAAAGGVPIVMLHGFSGDRELWSRLAGHLRGHHLIAPDMIGHGDTPFVPGADYSAPGLAARVIALLDALRIDRCHLVGNSLGGFVSATVARTAPSRVASLTLICAAGVAAPSPSRVDALRAGGENPFLMHSRADFDAFYPLTMARPPFVPGFVRASIAAGYVARREQLAEIHSGYFHRFLLDEHLGEISAPTLVLWGRQDQLIDVSSTEVWIAGLPDARLTIYDDLGHMPMLEDPARVAADISAFISSRQ